MAFVDFCQYLRWQAARFRAEDERIAGQKLWRSGILGVVVGMASLRLGGQSKQPGLAQQGPARGPIRVHRNAGDFGVIHSRPAQLGSRQIEAQRFHQMQFRPGICAKPDDIPRVGRNLRSDEDNMEHVRVPPKNVRFRAISRMGFRAKSRLQRPRF